MAIQILDPISSAMQRAKLITFQPFDVGKWFVLGFCAFLASFGQGGGSFSNFNVFNGGRGNGGAGGAPGPSPFDAVTAWIAANRMEAAVIAGFAALVLISIWLLILWLSSRGQFMFLDGIAKNTAEVVAPWKRYRRLGNSLFGFRVCLAAISIVAVLAIAALSFLLAWHDIQTKTFGSGAIAAVIVGPLLLLLTVIFLGLISWCTATFVTTIMYARDATVGVAWRDFRSNILSGHVGSVILFLLMSVVLSMAVVVIAMLLGCLTLCIGFLPYLGSVLTLPLAVFLRSYSIYFLQQFGPEYVIISEPPPNFGFQVIMPPPPPLP